MQSLIEMAAKSDPVEFERLMFEVPLKRSDSGLVLSRWKDYPKETKVSKDEVLEFLYEVLRTDKTKLFHNKVVRGQFFTTSSFTEDAIKVAADNPILELVDWNSMGKWFADVMTDDIANSARCAKSNYENRSKAEKLRQDANAAQVLAEQGKTDEALELIYKLATDYESLMAKQLYFQEEE